MSKNTIIQTARIKESPDDKGVCGSCTNQCQNKPDGMYGEMMVLDYCSERGISPVKKDIFLCGKTPDGEDVYTDGEGFYRTDELTCYRYFGEIRMTSGYNDWHFIVGSCKA